MLKTFVLVHRYDEPDQYGLHTVEVTDGKWRQTNTEGVFPLKEAIIRLDNYQADLTPLRNDDVEQSLQRFIHAQIIPLEWKQNWFTIMGLRERVHIYVVVKAPGCHEYR